MTLVIVTVEKVRIIMVIAKKVIVRVVIVTLFIVTVVIVTVVIVTIVLVIVVIVTLVTLVTVVKVTVVKVILVTVVIVTVSVVTVVIVTYFGKKLLVTLTTNDMFSGQRFVILMMFFYQPQLLTFKNMHQEPILRPPKFVISGNSSLLQCL